MPNLLSRLTMVKVSAPPSAPSVNAELFAKKRKSSPSPESAEAGTRLSLFVHPKTLTFTVAVGMIKLAWMALAPLEVAVLQSVWVPFTLCLLVGGIVSVNNLLEEKLNGPMFALGLLMGLLNSLVMFAAVLGIPK